MKKNILLATIISGSFLIASAQAPVKKVVLEDFTGTWCGWCPEGTVVIEALDATHGANFIAIANHSGDALEVPDGAGLDAGFSISSYPSGAVDRYNFPTGGISRNRGYWASDVTTRLAVTPIASISIKNQTWDEATRQLEVDVEAMFVSADAAIAKSINLGILEDSIPATGTFNQSNYSSSIQGGASPLNPWFHNHTLMDWLDGTWGDATVVPLSPTLSTPYTKHYSYTLPSTIDFNHTHIVAILTHNGTTTEKDVINAESAKIAYNYNTGVNTVGNQFQGIACYPNPTNSVANIQFNVETAGVVTMDVYDMTGSKIATPINNFYNGGTHTINWDLKSSNGTKVPAGNYAVRLSNSASTKTVTISVN